MRANYLQPVERARVSRKSMTDYLIRASVDKQMDARLEEHKNNIWKEMNAYAAAVDATWFWTLHQQLGWGAKRIRRMYEAIIRNRIAYRQFFRDGTSYEEKVTGENAEDEAIVKELLSIGVDIKAWEAETIVIDDETGEVSFIKDEQ
jgi:hypothetical protein